jgi:hypothetical protein
MEKTGSFTLLDDEKHEHEEREVLRIILERIILGLEKRL